MMPWLGTATLIFLVFFAAVFITSEFLAGSSNEP